MTKDTRILLFVGVTCVLCCLTPGVLFLCRSSVRLWQEPTTSNEQRTEGVRNSELLATASHLQRTADVSDLDNLDTVRMVAFSADGSRLITSGSRTCPDYFPNCLTSALRIYDAGSQEPFREIHMSDATTALAIEPSGSRFAVGTQDGRITVWGPPGEESAVRTLQNSYAGGLAFTPAGDSLFAGDMEGRVWHWDLSSGMMKIYKVGHRLGVRVIAVSPGGDLVASGGLDDNVSLLNLDKETAVQLASGGEDIMALAFSPDGTLLAIGDVRGIIRTWDVTAKRMTNMVQIRGEVACLAFSQDGSLLAAADPRTGAQIWRLETDPGDPLVLSNCEDAQVRAVAFGPAPNEISALCSNGTFIVWSLP